MLLINLCNICLTIHGESLRHLMFHRKKSGDSQRSQSVLIFVLTFLLVFVLILPDIIYLCIKENNLPVIYVDNLF